MHTCESPTKLTTDVFATGCLLQEQLESLEDRCRVNQEKGSDLKEKRHELQEVLKLFEMIEENEKRATAELEDTLARVRARYTVQDSDSAVLLPSSVESGVAGDSADIKPPAGLEPQPSGSRLLSSPSWVSDSDASRPLCQREVLVDAGCATGENAFMALPEAGAILANPEEGANPREEIVMPPASRRERSLSSLSALQRRVLQAMDITPPRDGAAPDVEPAAAGGLVPRVFRLVTAARVNVQGMAGKTPGRAERMGGSAKHFSKNPRGPVKTMPYKLRRRSSFGAGHAGPVGAQAAMASQTPTGAWKSYIRGGAGEKIDVDGGEEAGA